MRCGVLWVLRNEAVGGLSTVAFGFLSKLAPFSGVGLSNAMGSLSSCPGSQSASASLQSASVSSTSSKGEYLTEESISNHAVSKLGQEKIRLVCLVRRRLAFCKGICGSICSDSNDPHLPSETEKWAGMFHEELYFFYTSCKRAYVVELNWTIRGVEPGESHFVPSFAHHR